MGLKPTNKKFDNDKRMRHGLFLIRLGQLSIYVCILLFVSIGCNAACGSIGIDEFDPTSLLAIDSEQQEQNMPDAQMPFYVDMSIQIEKPVASQLKSNLFQATGTTAANFTAEIGDKLPPASPATASVSGEQFEHPLQESRKSPPVQSHDNSKSNELRQIIEQVRSVKFEKYHGESVEPQQPAQQNADTAPAVPFQPTVAALPDETEPQPLASSAATHPAGESTSNLTLLIIEEQLKDPNQITNPFELAEILFRSGRLVQAGLCYKQALNIMPTDDPNLGTERAWILFQIGNCLKDEDPNTARESYSELIRTHPDSPWTEIAKIRYGLIEWSQQEKPVELIQQLKQAKP